MARINPKSMTMLAGDPTADEAYDGLQEAIRSDVPDGRLWVTPGYYQTDSDQAVVLDSANDWIAVRIVPTTDILISAVSRFVPDVSTAGAGTLAIYSDATAPEPNGELNGSSDVAPTMTAEDAPSPYFVKGFQADGTTECGYNSPTFAGWKAFDGNAATYWSAYAKKSINNGEAAVDKGGTPNKVGIPCTGHGFETGQPIRVVNTVNYDGAYTVDAASTTDEVVIESAYVAENFGPDDGFEYGATASVPRYLVIDHGDGNAVAYNRYGFYQVTTGDGFPSAWSLYGSNEAAPDPATPADWSSALDTQSSVASPGVGLPKHFAFTNGTAYRWYMWKFTGPANGGGTITYHAIAEIELFAAQELSAPGTQIKQLGTLSSGAAADVWTRAAIAAGSQYQAQRHVPIWLVEKGEAAKNYSVSTRRFNTNAGSAFPDEMNLCKTTTDGGATWTQALQDNLPAMWNVVVNSVAGDHVPQLIYGRYNGKYCYLPGIGMLEIPEAGVLLDCSGSTADTLHYIYARDNGGGTLGLQAAPTANPVLNEGIEVATGATDRRYVGVIVPKTLISTHNGPVDVEDWRMVANRHNRVVKSFGKRAPYSGQSHHEQEVANVWELWNFGDDYLAKLVVCVPVTLRVVINATPASTSQYTRVGLKINKIIPQHVSVGNFAYTGVSYSTAAFLPLGVSEVVPMVTGNASANLRLASSVQFEGSWWLGEVEL